MTINKQAIQNALFFLQRSNLQGSEVTAFVATVAEIEKILTNLKEENEASNDKNGS